jgi:hypothetical protein
MSGKMPFPPKLVNPDQTLQRWMSDLTTFITTSVATSPLTTKGDVWGYSTTNARIPVGTDGQVLTADSAQVLGVKWATPSGGSGTRNAAMLARYT